MNPDPSCGGILVRGGDAPRKGRRHATTTATLHRGYATGWAFGKDPGSLESTLSASSSRGSASRPCRSPRRTCGGTSCTWSKSSTSPAAPPPSPCAVKRFFEVTLGRTWTTLELARPAPEAKLPVDLSREEVAAVLAEIHMSIYRACLTTIYTCGLRLMEGARLTLSDIDASRMAVHVRGKGNHDRLVPLPEPILAKVRSYGLLAPRNRARLDAVLAQLATTGGARMRMPAPASQAPVLHRCPVCNVGTMRLIRTLPPRRGPP